MITISIVDDDTEILKLVGSRLGSEYEEIKEFCCIDNINYALLLNDLKNIYKIDNKLLNLLDKRIKLIGILESLSESDNLTQISCKTALNFSADYINNNPQKPKNQTFEPSSRS